MFLSYASRHGRALIDRALYLPLGWAADTPRRARAGVPAAIAFATKPQLGLAILERALEAGVPCAWVADDSVYGADHWLRRAIEARCRGYVLAVTSRQRLGLVPVGEWPAEILSGGWQRLSAGDGAKGPRLADWAWLPYRGAAPGWEKGLLVRRSMSKPADLTYYLTHAPETTTLTELVVVVVAMPVPAGRMAAAEGLHREAGTAVMATSRRMNLVAYVKTGYVKTGPTANHAGGWRHPTTNLHDIFDPRRYAHPAWVLQLMRAGRVG